MTAEEVEAKLAEIARAEVDWEGELPRGELSEALDSVALLTLVVAVEDRFEICLTPQDEQEIRTVPDLVRVILGKIDGTAATDDRTSPPALGR